MRRGVSNSKRSPTRLPATSSDMGLAAVLGATCLVVPWLFVLALDDVFAVPKLTALTLAALVGGVVLGRSWRVARLERRLALGFIDLALAGLVLWNALAVLLSLSPIRSVVGEPLLHQGFFSLMLYVAFFYLARFATTEEAGLFLVLAGVAAGATVVAAYALVQRADLDPIWAYPERGRVFSTLGQPNALAAYLVFGIPAAAALLVRHQTGWFRGPMVLSIGMMVAALVLSFSRAGYAAFVAVVSMLLLPLWRGLRDGVARSMFVSSLIIGATLIPFIHPFRTALIEVPARAASSLDIQERSVQEHLALWAVAVRVIVDHPVLGIGPEMFPEMFPRYRDLVLTSDDASLFIGKRAESPHNVYLAIAIGAGLPALVAYFTFLVGCSRELLRACRDRGSPERRIALLAVLAAVVGHLISDVFMTADVTSTWLLWLFLGAGVGMTTALDHPGARPA